MFMVAAGLMVEIKTTECGLGFGMLVTWEILVATVTGVEVRNLVKNGLRTAFFLFPKCMWENTLIIPCDQDHLLRQRVLFIPE